MILSNIFIFFCLCCIETNSLLYPASSTLSFVSSLSVPVVEYFPERRILMDWCFATGFALPSSLSSFYNVPIWPAKNKEKRYLDEINNTILTDNTTTNLHLFDKYSNNSFNFKKHPKDFTAGELYQSFEDFLVSYGVHETCLLRTVCEITRHPFEDNKGNLFTEIITFLLTPSLHKGFDINEQLYQEIYEEAERYGFQNKNCSDIYRDCKINLLDSITKVLFKY